VTVTGSDKQGEMPTSSPTSSRLARAVTGRSLLLGAVGSAAIGLLAPYAIHVLRGSYMALDFSTPAAVALLFLLVAGPNLLLVRFRQKLALTTAEIITIYSMMVVASAIPTMGVTAQIIPLTTGAHYYASPENKWDQVILPHLASWLAPRGAAPRSPVIGHLYEGLPAGAQVPWQAWLPALGAWIPFLLCLHLVMICMMVLLRKQWVDNERLAYPLTYLPLALAGADSGGRPTILLRGTFWIGFALAFLMGTLRGLHHYFPGVPAIDLTSNVTVVKDIWSLSFRLSFPMLGFFYLVSVETSFSVWFFNLLTQMGTAIVKFLGIVSSENLGIYGARDPLLKYLGSGAFLALVGSNLWISRRHLKIIWERAMGRGHREDDAGEIVSYRFAFWVMVAGLIVIGWWLAASGMPPVVVPLFLLMAFVFFIGLTRVVAESGMAEAVAPSIAPASVAGWLGIGPLGPKGMLALGLTYVWCSDIRTFVMCSAANSLKMAQVVEHKPHRFFWGFVIAIAVALVSSMWLTMTRAYQQGGVTMNKWFFEGAPVAQYKWVADWIVREPRPSIIGLVITAVGAGIYILLAAMRFRFPRWPFHPIGYCIGSVWIMDNIWFTCFLSWLVKGTILRYGGMKGYQYMRPIFLGLICGQFTCNTVWLLIDQLAGGTGNQIFWI